LEPIPSWLCQLLSDHASVIQSLCRGQLPANVDIPCWKFLHSHRSHITIRLNLSNLGLHQLPLHTVRAMLHHFAVSGPFKVGGSPISMMDGAAWAHAVTIIIASLKAISIHDAWLAIQEDHRLGSGRDFVAVTAKAVTHLEQEMFSQVEAAGMAGLRQWGLSSGRHQDNWDPYNDLDVWGERQMWATDGSTMDRLSEAPKV
jgi:hypothetical protein